jgi:hypothetical protein
VKGAAAADVAATLAILALVIGAALAPPVLRRLAARPSPEACQALVERYVELVARAADPSPAPSVIAERKALARAAAGDRGFARCEAELTREEVACALRVGSADEIERCLP